MTTTMRPPALLFADEERLARLTDVLGRAAQRNELTWLEVDGLLVLVERYGLPAGEPVERAA